MSLKPRVVLGVLLLILSGTATLAPAREMLGKGQILMAALFRSQPKDAEYWIGELKSADSRDVVDALEHLEKKFPRNTNAVLAIRSFITDSRIDVRRKAVRILGIIRAEVDDKDIQNICALLRASNTSEVVDGLKGLRGLDAPQAVTNILPLLKDSREGVVREACRTLAVLGDKNLIPSIEPLLARPEKGIKQDAQDAISKLSSKGPSAPRVASVPTKKRVASSGTGFFITEDGYLITNHHVVNGADSFQISTVSGLLPAKLVKADKPNDLAVLKVEGKFPALPIVSSRSVKPGSTVGTVGFPNPDMQGYAPKVTKGEVASLSGVQDDPRDFQISVAMQPGNSGGPLVDVRGNVVGVVVGKLSRTYALRNYGILPENVNYAVKSSFLLGFLESLPEVAAKLKEPNTADMIFEDAMEKAGKAAVFVLAN